MISAVVAERLRRLTRNHDDHDHQPLKTIQTISQPSSGGIAEER